MSTLLRIHELGEGDVLITPNLRSARVWSLAASTSDSSATARALPTVMATSQWLALVWEALRTQALAKGERLPKLLSAGQERAVWQRVIARAAQTPTGFSGDALVVEAMRAWKLANTWAFPEALLSGDDSLEISAYAAWQTAFRAALTKLSAISAAQLPRTLTADFADGEAWPHSVRCNRIVTLPTLQDDPALAGLLAALSARGIARGQLVWRYAPVAPRCVQFERAVDEWSAAAQWAKAHVARNPSAQVVIVVPQLHTVRHAMRRVLRDVLVPEHWGDPLAESGARFNLSLGVRLSEVPRVACALAWLRWLRAPLPVAEVRMAMGAAFISPQIPAAQFWYAEEIKRGTLALTIHSFARRVPPAHPIHALIAQGDGWPARALPSQWSTHFASALVALGFAAGEMDSESAQAVVALLEVIEGVAELDAVLGNCAEDTVMRELTERSVTHDFQGEGQGAPIQVLGLYESLGIACDAMWVTGASDEVLPEPSELSPLLPRAWQRIAGVGRATPALMADAAARVWAQWERAAPDLVVSVSGGTQALPVRPAACIPAAQFEQFSAIFSDVTLLATTEKITDTCGVVFEAVTLPAGTSLLQHQAECGFQAYAAHRLRVDPFPLPQIGVPASLRGEVVHSALAILWHKVETLEAWNSAAFDEQETCIADAVALAMQPIVEACRRRALPDGLAPLLSAQLKNLLLEWMTTEEAPRRAFTVTHAETTVPLTLAAHTLNLRLDRVDQLEDGSALVIDYKTGAMASPAALRDGQGAALYPQLPAYALAMGATTRVEGVAFARVARDKLGLRGLARVEADPISTNTWRTEPAAGQARPQMQIKAAEWDALLMQWQQALSASVSAFAAGEAGVAPAMPTACRNCQRHALCRIGAQEISEADDEE
jgi:ATP-dependent helicase/nuclease subunit B